MPTDVAYRINSDGAEVLTLLQEIYDAGVLPPDNYWALRMRPQIRRESPDACGGNGQSCAATA